MLHHYYDTYANFREIILGMPAQAIPLYHISFLLRMALWQLYRATCDMVEISHPESAAYANVQFRIQLQSLTGMIHVKCNTIAVQNCWVRPSM